MSRSRKDQVGGHCGLWGWWNRPSRAKRKAVSLTKVYDRRRERAVLKDQYHISNMDFTYPDQLRDDVLNAEQEPYNYLLDDPSDNPNWMQEDLDDYYDNYLDEYDNDPLDDWDTYYDEGLEDDYDAYDAYGDYDGHNYY